MIDLDEHRRLDAAAMAQQKPERYPWTWAHNDVGTYTVNISQADAELIVRMRNDHMALIEELAALRAILGEMVAAEMAQASRAATA